MEQHVLAYIGLGANVGAPREALERAVSALAAAARLRPRRACRGCTARGPSGPVAQGDFLNAVVALRAPAGATPAAGAMALLLALKGLERAMGRVRRERWGPREIDLDLLLFGDAEIHVEREASARSDDPDRGAVQWLDVPHASAAERSFVLAPLADLARAGAAGPAATGRQTRCAPRHTARTRRAAGRMATPLRWRSSAGAGGVAQRSGRWRDHREP